MRFADYPTEEYAIVFPALDRDLQTAYDYMEEFYRLQCPEVTYRELNKEVSQELNGVEDRLAALHGEQAPTGPVWSREIKLHVHPELTSPLKRQHTQRGNEIERLAIFHIGIPLLQKADLYPSVGDHILHGRYNYELVDVYVKEDSRWGNTNIALHVCCDGVIYRPGDNISQQRAQALQTNSLPASLPPRSIHPQQRRNYR